MHEENCGNCKKYKLNGGKCLGVRSRHCKDYKKVDRLDAPASERKI